MIVHTIVFRVFLRLPELILQTPFIDFFLSFLLHKLVQIFLNFVQVLPVLVLMSQLNSDLIILGLLALWGWKVPIPNFCAFGELKGI